MSFRLQLEALKWSPPWHTPVHLTGAGGIPRSSKLGLSGHRPVSRMPTMVPRPYPDRAHAPVGQKLRPRNLRRSARTDATPGSARSDAASPSVSCAAKPSNTVWYE
nr:unnamed protein product [Digitaria exilis]